MKKKVSDRLPRSARPEKALIGPGLFPDAGPDFTRDLELLRQAIAETWPLTGAHEKDLPAHIGDLSRTLTSSRADLRLPYWSKPANISAYLYYFLPWNIIRLGRMLAGLDLPAPEVSGAAMPLLLDAGSGPLTLPLALWLARPQWRAMPLHILACDTSRQPLDLGMRILHRLATLQGQKVWKVIARKAPASQLAQCYACLGQEGAPAAFYPWLVAETNILNEILTKSARRQKSGQEQDEEGECEENAAARLLQSWLPIWQNAQNALALFVEPGTRLGGDTLMRLRSCALQMGFSALAPCVHDKSCPLLQRGRKRGSHAKAWCHFTFAATPPKWLKQIAREAGLEKTTLSLSLLLLGAKQTRPRPENTARVISQPFRANSLQGMARYVCLGKGLGLVAEAPGLESSLLLELGEATGKDEKSGAAIYRLAARP